MVQVKCMPITFVPQGPRRTLLAVTFLKEPERSKGQVNNVSCAGVLEIEFSRYHVEGYDHQMTASREMVVLQTPYK